jgi:hypothetical protein
MRSVGRSEAARDAARFTAVVVLPTPPFWFATARIQLRDPRELSLRSPGGLFDAMAA